MARNQSRLFPVRGNGNAIQNPARKWWIIVNSNGNRGQIMLLEPSDDQSFDPVERFHLVLGNAGGLAKTNTKAAFGSPGNVVRVWVNELARVGLLEDKSTR